MTVNEKTSRAAVSDPKFARLSEDFIHEILVSSPLAASQAGYHRHVDGKTGKPIELDAVLDDMSPASIQARRELYASWRERFRKDTPLGSLSVEDSCDWQMIDDQIGLTLLEFDRIQSYKHNPTLYVELLGAALFEPLMDEYAPAEVRLGHILSRISGIPRFLDQAQQELVDTDPIYVKVAVEENQGNLDLIQETIAAEIPRDSRLRTEFDKVARPALEALKGFSRWLEDDLAKRTTSTTWRLGKELYAEKFRLVMETPVSPEQVLADAESDLKSTRAEMLKIALPLHKQMYPDHGDHSDLSARELENKIIGEVLEKISDDHPKRDEIRQTITQDMAGIRRFIGDKKIVSLKARDKLKVIPTPPFLRATFSAGFHSAAPLDPSSQAQYWVTPIDPKVPEKLAESKLREYNRWVLKWLTIHEALPGHFVQFEYANDIQPVTRRLTRALFANGPCVEGWAEYIAQVMMQEGFADNDPRYRLSYLKVCLRVMANAILDVRMHTMNMSDADATDLMMNDAFQTQAEAEGKLQRAKLHSTQLSTYYVGMREWWRLRKQYEAAKGKHFRLMEFHDRVLGEGALPVPLLAKIVLAE